MNVKKYIEKSDLEDLFHVDIAKLMRENNIGKKEMLDVLIKALFQGDLMIEWIYHCPHCGNVAKETLNLHSASHTDYCPVCKVEFDNKLDVNIEVFFTVHPNVKKLPPELKENYYLEVQEGLKKSGPEFWKNEKTIYGVDLIQNNTFRELIGSDILLVDQSLEILKVTILFTDLKGSTKLYNDLGDVKAFSLVRNHFSILFDKIKINNGVPIKTIGDAVMGVFLNESDAIKASLEIQETLIKYYETKPKNEQLELKIGLHSGPALLVTLNDKLDYFGQSVNIAARVQGSALPNEVVFGEEIYKRNEILLKKYKNITLNEKKLKGLTGYHKLIHILLKKRAIKDEINVRFNRFFGKRVF